MKKGRLSRESRPFFRAIRADISCPCMYSRSPAIGSRCSTPVLVSRCSGFSRRPFSREPCFSLWPTERPSTFEHSSWAWSKQCKIEQKIHLAGWMPPASAGSRSQGDYPSAPPWSVHGWTRLPDPAAQQRVRWAEVNDRGDATDPTRSATMRRSPPPLSGVMVPAPMICTRTSRPHWPLLWSVLVNDRVTEPGAGEAPQGVFLDAMHIGVPHCCFTKAG